MIEEPLITVITPSYNQGAYIKATIDSVLGQQYDNIEYFVMDGGSTDNTLAILRSNTDPRIRWVSEKDKGQSDAINKGLHRATGKYLTYLNSDDLLLPGALKVIADYFESHPRVDLIYGDYSVINTHGREVRIFKASEFDLRKMVLGGQTLPQPGAFWRSDVTERIGYMDEALHYTMDVDYWIRAALAGFNLDYVSGTRSAFRIHQASKTGSQKHGFSHDWKLVLDKVYAAADIPQEILEIKQSAYQQVEWNRLKVSWANGTYDNSALNPFLRNGSPQQRIIAALMLAESYCHLPLLRTVDEAYARFSGQRIIR